MGEIPKYQEAIDKLKKIAEAVRICMLASPDGENRAHGWPMSTIKIEDDGTLWFFTKNKQAVTDRLENDHDVTLFYSHPGKNAYLTVQGSATFVNDQGKMEELYNPALKAWFPRGLDEPDIVLLKVTPYEAHYWDTDAPKIVVLFSMDRAVAI
jgi:general stress protein 26